MKAWVVEKHGSPSHLKTVERKKPEPGPMEAVVRVLAVGLNHLDLWVRKGVPGHEFPLPMILGSDIVGRIENVGPLSEGLKNRLEKEGLEVGSRVVVQPLVTCGRCPFCEEGNHYLCSEFGILGESQDGGCADFACVPVNNLVALPESVSDIAAASLPIAYVTAWSMLFRHGKVQPGEMVLVQAGGSGVSVAAIQIAKLLGATVLTTVGSEEKKKKAALIGADLVMNYKQQDFVKEVRTFCKKQRRSGVDLVVDHIGKDTLASSLRCLRPGGKVVTCGATSGSDVFFDLKPLFFKSLSIIGSTMGSRSDLQKILGMVEQKKIKPVVDRTFKMSELPEAHTHLEERRAFGKVVVTN